MATDGKVTFKQKGKKPKSFGVKGSISPSDWAKFEKGYKALALGVGLKVTSLPAKKKAVKKKAATKKSAKKK